MLIGALITADDDALTLRLDRTERVLRVPRLSIRTLEVSTGKPSGKGTGTIVGAVAGALLVYVTHNPCPEPESDCPLGSHVGERLGGAAVGALAYGLVGGAIGSLFKTDEWSPVSLEDVRLSLVPARGRGVRLFVSVAF